MGSLILQGQQPTAGCPRERDTAQLGFCPPPQTFLAPAEGDEVATSIGCHQPFCYTATRSLPCSNPDSFLAPMHIICQGERMRGCCQTPLGISGCTGQLRGWNVGCPGQAAAGRVVQELHQLLPALLTALQTKLGPGISGLSPISALHS